VTAMARIVAVIAGLACMSLAAAELVKQGMLAAEPGMVWPASAWWAELTGDPLWTTTGVAAAITAAAAIALIVYAIRQLGDSRRGPELVEFAAEGCRARLSVPGLERALARRLEAVLPGARVARVGLTRGAEGWRARVEADMPAVDLAGAREHALAVLTRDLERMGGIGLVRLDLVVRALSTPAGVAK